MDKIIREIIDIAKANNLSANDLIDEVECLETYGQYLHIDLMGYRSFQVREAARVLSELAA